MKCLKSRILASVLTVTMLIGAIPLEGLAMEPAKETLPVAEASETEASEIIGECTDKRDEYTKQFLLSDGSFLVCQYVEPVHYYEDDTWKDIDNTLEEESGEDMQENKNNDVKIKFSNKAKKSNMVTIKNKDYQVSWGILDARKPKFKTIEQKSDASDEDENPASLKKLASSGIYENVFSGVDLRYTIVSKSVKEDIILNHKYTRNTFSFDYQLKGLEMRLNENGEIEVYNSEEVVYVMDQPFMYDSNEKAVYSDKVSVALTGEKGKYTLTLTADEEWLQASDRVYPVIIDPSVQPVTNAYNVKDTTRAVNSNISASAKSALQSVGEYVTMKVGSRYGSELQGLIYFDIPSVIPSSAKIINAQMGLYFTERATTSMQVNAHMITSDWNTSNISENYVLYGSSTPTHDSNVIDYQIFSTSAEYKYYMFDITSAVQKWSTGLAPNYGILLAAESVPQSDSYVRFCDSDHLGSYDPQYQVTYRDNKGLEDYWTYHTQALGKRATGYVNDYSGNLVIVENCFTMPGERMPFSFMLVYDQSRVVDTATYNATVGAKCGNGWRLACVQRLKENPIEGIRQTYPYIYTDGDGTEHYFVSDGNGTYQDEDGLGLTLSLINETVDENTTQLSYSIVTKDKITMKFDSAGFLRRIQDTESNTIAFHYRQPTSDPESSVLTSITDAVGRTISVGMGNDGWLMSAHTSTGEGFCYEYDEQGRLTSVVDKNSTETRYVYNENNCIVRVYEYGMNSPESVIEYTYTSYTPYRVASITEYTKNKTEVGRSISNITYDHNQTRFTDNKGRTQTYQFDTWGCTTSVINHEGAASTYSYEHEGNKNNKFSSSGKSQVNVRNYLYNTSGESNSAWSEAKESLDGSTVQGTVQYSTSQKYLGNRSFEASAESIGQARIAHKQNVYLAAGTYTLSAYLKTDNVTSADHGAGLSVQYVDANGNTVLEEGDWTTGTKDWHRQTLTFTVPTDGTTATVYLGLLQASGSAYFDAVQLEAGKVANKYNMLQDGSFEVANANLLPYWNGSNLVTSDRESTAAGTVKDGAKSFKFDGSASKNKMIYQTIPVQGNEGDVFSVSGWAKGASVNLSGDRKFSISTKVLYSDGTDKWEDHNFNTCVEDWQFLSFIVSTDDNKSATQKTYTGLEVYFCYHQNENTVYIDNFQVNKDVGQTYVYDEEGNLISSASLAELETSFQYQNDNVKQLVSPDGSNYEYSYGYSGHNLLLGARSSGGVSYKFGYNVLSGYGTTDVAQTAGDKYSSTLVAGKSYYIRNRYTGKNLQPSNQVSANGTALVQYEPSISYYQKWTLQDAGDGYYYLTLGDASDRKLSVRGGSATANQPLELQTTLTDASKFRIEPSTEGIHYAIRSKLDNSMAVVSQSANTSNNNPIVMASYDGAGTEKEWYFVEATQSDYTAPVGGEVYYITNHLTNQVFDIPTFATNTGTALTQYAFMAGPNQQFKLEVSGDYILLVPQHSTDKAIAVGSDGTSLTLQNKNATDSNQQFQMTLLSNSAYRIVPRNYPNKTISQGSSVAQASAPLTLMNYTGEIWQQWRFTKPVDYTKSDVPESGEVYYIRFNHNYYYLDVPGMANTAGTILNQYALNSFLNQQYELQTASDGYFRIRPMHTKDEMFLTLAIDETRTDGAGIIELQTRQDSPYQEFKFVPSTNHTYRLVCKVSTSDAFCMEVPNGAYGYSVQVKYAPCTGNGEAWQRISLESIGGIIRTSAGYTEDRNYTTSVTDAAGNTTQYQYNEDTGLIHSTTNAKGQTTTYTYDWNKRLTKVSDGVEEVTYTYNDQNRLSKISIPSGTNYYLYYDSFGNVTNIMAAGMELIRNTYESNNGNLLSSTYGDGSRLSYSYDSFDRVTQKLYNDVTAVEYLYDSLGHIYSKNDALANQIIRYEYDFNDRITSLRSNDGLYQTYTYDNRNRLSSYTNGIGSISQTTGFLYGEKATVGVTGQKEGYLYGVTVNGEKTQSYEYDYLSRLLSKRLDGANNYQVRYEYYQGANNVGTAKTTGMVSAVVNGNTRLEYTYDELGNISTYSKNGVLQESYTYDNQNQLSTVTKGSDVWQYSYGYNGNLSQVKKNGVIVKDYKYKSALWEDVLSHYNDGEIEYGKDNNLYKYHDGREFTWQNGRWLVGVNGNVGGQNQDIDYAYNSDGLRISKTVNNTTTEFYWLDDCLIGQKTGNEYIVYLYDENGTAYGFLFTDGITEEYYYYVFNLQGDIIGILDEQGNQVVEYSYDVWGYPLGVTGTMANTIGQKNPLRYRGYYYDSETGFYYLNTRYYDPELGRFLNPDAAIGQIGSVQGSNMFAYCFNNPVNMSDPSGNWPKLSTLFKAVAVVATVVAIAAVCVAAVSLAPVAIAGGGTILMATAGTTAALGVAATAGKVALATIGAAAVLETAEKAYDDLPKDHTVYGLQDVSTGQIEYVGRTKDPEKRAAAHKSNPARANLEMVPLATGLNAVEARGVEQIQMLVHHTINTANRMNNQINGISPSNSKLNIYMEAGRGALAYLGNQISNDILYWTGN